MGENTVQEENKTYEELLDEMKKLPAERNEAQQGDDIQIAKENEMIKLLADGLERQQGKLDKLRQRCLDADAIVIFDNEQYEELCIAKNEVLYGFPSEPIEVAEKLINANYKRKLGNMERGLRKALGENDLCNVVLENVYSVSDLRQIAEHLLVYCNANEEEDG